LNFCRCKQKMLELLAEEHFVKRVKEGFSVIGLVLRGGVPVLEKVKYLMAMASPRLSFRAAKMMVRVKRA